MLWFLQEHVQNIRQAIRQDDLRAVCALLETIGAALFCQSLVHRAYGCIQRGAAFADERAAIRAAAVANSRIGAFLPIAARDLAAARAVISHYAAGINTSRHVIARKAAACDGASVISRHAAGKGILINGSHAATRHHAAGNRSIVVSHHAADVIIAGNAARHHAAGNRSVVLPRHAADAAIAGNACNLQVQIFNRSVETYIAKQPNTICGWCVYS